jgi:phage terminase large subunit-like protein
MGGKVILDDNPITRYCYRNVVLRMDVNGNVKPDKQKEKKKIDGVTAGLQALAMYQEYANTYVGKIF